MMLRGVLCVLLGLCALLVHTPAAQAQQACPPKGTVLEWHDFYEGFVYSYDHGWVRVTALGGNVSYSNTCEFIKDDGEKVKIPLTAQLRRPVGGAAARPRPAANWGAIPVGVYECDVPQMIGGMVMPSPSTGHMFGVFGPGSYRDFRGGRGSFTFSDNILTMTSGPLKGIRYRREGATLFYPIDAKGKRGSIRCVLNKAKSLNGRW